MSAAAQSARRAQCSRCLRPATACICRWITAVASDAAMLILQHPMEVSNAKGSARLLHLSVDGSVMATGESFEPDTLRRLLNEGGRAPVLLYPDLPGERELGVAQPPAFDPALLADPVQVRLVILDGTWRKSRKMLYQNPLLQALPRLALSDVPASHYLIRKAHAVHQLSTLEAACHALAQLHYGDTRFAPLLQAFDEFVAHFQATAGKLGDTAT